MHIERRIYRTLEASALALDGIELHIEGLLDDATRLKINICVAIAHRLALQSLSHAMFAIVTDGARVEHKLAVILLGLHAHRPPLIGKHGATHGAGYGMQGGSITLLRILQHSEGHRIAVLLKDGELALATLIHGDARGIDLRTVLIAVVEDSRQAGHHLLASHLQTNRQGNVRESLLATPLVATHTLHQIIAHPTIGVTQQQLTLLKLHTTLEDSPLATLLLRRGVGVHPSAHPVLLPASSYRPKTLLGRLNNRTSAKREDGTLILKRKLCTSHQARAQHCNK